MKFFNFKSVFHKKQVDFNNIEGYQDIKNIINRALESEDNYNILLCGKPACAKSLFLQGIMEYEKDAVFLDGSNTTSKILDVIEEKRPKIILLDEIGLMSRQFQGMLLNFLESGRVKVTQMKRNYDFELKGCKVFGTTNSLSKLSKPLQSRFRILHIPPYNEEQFLNISIKVLPRLSESIARYIGATVWKNQGDIRNVINIGKLVRKDDGPEQISEIIQTMCKYNRGDSQE